MSSEFVRWVSEEPRCKWRDQTRPIEPATVARIRAATVGRTDQWTEKELLQVK